MPAVFGPLAEQVLQLARDKRNQMDFHGPDLAVLREFKSGINVCHLRRMLLEPDIQPQAQDACLCFEIQLTLAIILAVAPPGACIKFLGNRNSFEVLVFTKCEFYESAARMF
jgi:hypothetical protein